MIINGLNYSNQALRLPREIQPMKPMFISNIQQVHFLNTINSQQSLACLLKQQLLWFGKASQGICSAVFQVGWVGLRRYTPVKQMMGFAFCTWKPLNRQHVGPNKNTTTWGNLHGVALIHKSEPIFLGVTHRKNRQLIETGPILCFTPTACPH